MLLFIFFAFFSLSKSSKSGYVDFSGNYEASKSYFFEIPSSNVVSYFSVRHSTGKSDVSVYIQKNNNGSWVDVFTDCKNFDLQCVDKTILDAKYKHRLKLKIGSTKADKVFGVLIYSNSLYFNIDVNTNRTVEAKEAFIFPLFKDVQSFVILLQNVVKTDLKVYKNGKPTFESEAGSYFILHFADSFQTFESDLFLVENRNSISEEKTDLDVTLKLHFGSPIPSRGSTQWLRDVYIPPSTEETQSYFEIPITSGSAMLYWAFKSKVAVSIVLNEVSVYKQYPESGRFYVQGEYKKLDQSNDYKVRIINTDKNNIVKVDGHMGGMTFDYLHSFTVMEVLEDLCLGTDDRIDFLLLGDSKKVEWDLDTSDSLELTLYEIDGSSEESKKSEKTKALEKNYWITSGKNQFLRISNPNENDININYLHINNVIKPTNPDGPTPNNGLTALIVVLVILLLIGVIVLIAVVCAFGIIYFELRKKNGAQKGPYKEIK